MLPTEIHRITAREVYDSRGRPTVEAEVTCHGGRPCRAIAPSGASTGSAEAWELRDGGPRLSGMGVRRAVQHLRTEIASALSGDDAADQTAIDERLIALDGTPNKSRLGANTVLAASLACAAAAADALGRSAVEHFYQLWTDHHGSDNAFPTLPLPMVNMISGGKHAGGQLDFQDFLLIPVGATTIVEGLEWIVTVYQRLGRVLTAAGYEGVLVGDEGGYGPRLKSNEEALDLLMQAITEAGYHPGEHLAIALDVAATHFYRNGHYHLAATGGEQLSAADLTERLLGWTDRYPIVSIEDPLAEDDWDGWQSLTQRFAGRVQLIGDDLFATNPQRVQRGIDQGVANAVLIKLNQIGTLTETLRTLKLAQQHGYRGIISARSGESEDVTIANLAVATGAGQIKIGSVARSERLAKYNQLLRLEDLGLWRLWPYASRHALAGKP